MKNLVIVESPTKAKTIGRFLGDDYLIKFSMGHVMDLPKSKLGIDIKNSFKPELEVVEDKKKIISELRNAAKSANSVILATDPDREGEAISANIQELLEEGKPKVPEEKFKRIVFHEITEDAIKDALSHPRKVDRKLVNAQIARRVLDRLVGYQLSPVLWQKVRRGLSAGRVQSVALRLIVEREREIEKFQKQQYWSVHVTFKKQSGDSLPVVFDLIEINKQKIESSETHTLYDGTYKVSKTSVDTEEKAHGIVSDIKKKAFAVSDVIEKETKRSPYAPYTTSTMQQDASRRFGFSGKRTMSLAQKLYEEGYITYHRTDSVVLSSSAVSAIRKHAEKEYGAKYLPEKTRYYASKQKNAQEAHEGIRPTKIQVSSDRVKSDMGADYAKLYDMIWRRAVASQMADAIIESTTVYADSLANGANAYRCKANGSVLKFDGFLKVYPQGLQDTKLPKFVADEPLGLVDAKADPHETAPPPRYNDASLIGALEDKSIGRPSTYASIIATLVERTYVERVEKRFEPTTVGMAVNDFLVTNFSDIDDIPFTAKMEDNLDDIANGEEKWVAMMQDFYTPFSKQLEKVKEAKRVKIEVEKTDEECPECGKGNLVVRTGKFGKFLSCERFPDCRFTKPMVYETDVLCPKDGGKVIIKKTRKGRRFFGCSNYPNCDFAAWKLEDIKGSTKSKSQNAKPQVKN